MIKKTILISAISALTGCAPLQQAPLIYTSKVSVGVDVSVGTENPDGSISIGFKSVDAAYVPIAVSKKLKDKDGTDLGNSGIIPIVATYGEVNQDSPVSQNDSGAPQEYIKAYRQARNDANTSSHKLATAQKSLEKLTASLAALQAQQETTAPDANEAASTGKKINAEIIAKKAEIITLQSDLQKKTATAETLFQKAAEAALSQKYEKTDALSVFGRFDSYTAATGSKPTASLTAGKIFSTGIASQNLTEAVKNEAGTFSITQCIEKASNFIKESVSDLDAKGKAELISKLCTPS